MSLAREIQGKLRELENMTNLGIVNTERSGIRKPAPTVEGKVEQAKQWLLNPAIDDKGLGGGTFHSSACFEVVETPKAPASETYNVHCYSIVNEGKGVILLKCWGF